jgi:hypothetical protein
VRFLSGLSGSTSHLVALTRLSPLGLSFSHRKRPRSAPLQRRSKGSKKDASAILEETSKFGHEPTHLCHLDQSKGWSASLDWLREEYAGADPFPWLLPDPLQLQIDLAERRLEEVELTLEKLRSGRASKQDAEVEGIPVDVSLHDLLRETTVVADVCSGLASG